MLGKKHRDVGKTLLSTSGLVVLLAILVIVNVIFSFAAVRWDATEDKIYSLSQGTRQILSDLKEDVTFKVFYSRSRPDIPVHIKTYAERVMEFLSEYAHFSGGRVKVELYDPKPDSDEEEWAQKYGMQPLSLPGGERLYCGLVAVAADQEEAIPFMDPAMEELLEYEISRIVYRLQSPVRKTIAIISSLPVFGGPPQPGQPGSGEPWFFVSELKKNYEVREIEPSADSLKGPVDCLLVIHPKEMQPKLQYALDQYLLRGGNALVFVDPLCVSDAAAAQNRFLGPGSSQLDTLFAAWGISMAKGRAIADMHQPTRLRTGTGQVEDNAMWISARGESIEKGDVMTSKLETMLFPVAGAIEKTEGFSLEWEPLVWSSTNSALINAFTAHFGAQAIRTEFASAGRALPIAVKIRGRFKTAFPEGPPKEPVADKPQEGNRESKKEAAAGHLKEGENPVTVVVAGDADMLADPFCVRRQNFLGFAIAKVFNDNLNFLLNGCELLTGGQALVGIRSRGKFERPFTRVMELQQRAQDRWLEKEKELVQRSEETNQRLRELEQQKDASQKLIISPEQQKEIARFKEERLKINRELKQVRRNLRSDIERLGTRLKFVNIFLMPLVVCLAGIGFAFYRQRRTHRP